MDPCRAMASSSSILPGPIEHRELKSILNRTPCMHPLRSLSSFQPTNRVRKQNLSLGSTACTLATVQLLRLSICVEHSVRHTNLSSQPRHRSTTLILCFHGRLSGSGGRESRRRELRQSLQRDLDDVGCWCFACCKTRLSCRARFGPLPRSRSATSAASAGIRPRRPPVLSSGVI